LAVGQHASDHANFAMAARCRLLNIVDHRSDRGWVRAFFSVAARGWLQLKNIDGLGSFRAAS
jgi:hypothetical protein